MSASPPPVLPHSKMVPKLMVLKCRPIHLHSLSSIPCQLPTDLRIKSSVWNSKISLSLMCLYPRSPSPESWGTKLLGGTPHTHTHLPLGFLQIFAQAYSYLECLPLSLNLTNSFSSQRAHFTSEISFMTCYPKGIKGLFLSSKTLWPPLPWHYSHYHIVFFFFNLSSAPRKYDLHGTQLVPWTTLYTQAHAVKSDRLMVHPGGLQLSFDSS